MTDESRTLERERWRRAREIYAGAIEHRGEARKAWLDEACGTDEALRREVESLLEYETAAVDFIETPVANVAGALGAHAADSLLQRRIGAYTVTSWLDAGGMGDVYRARDLHLERDVAIKVLPRGVADDPRRVARFEREAQLLGALNHPNIATIHGFERQGDVAAIVLELVEGSTLAELVETHRSRSPARGVRLEQSLRIALQIAEALEAAHAKGIVHRDLKPTNVKVRSDGIVKVLDFGIAKMLESLAEDPTGTAATSDPKQSHGIIGTPAYMSPEQARGEPVDKRTDIWAFGCVLYELLAGRPAFEGTTSSDLIAAVLDREPDFTDMPTEVPPVVSRLVQRCLRKDPQERLRDIGDAALDLKESLTQPRVAVGRSPAVRSPGWSAIAVAVLAVSVVVAAAAWLARPRTPASSPPVVRFTITLPEELRFRDSPGQEVAVSRDGMRLAYLTVNGIVVRSINQVNLAAITPGPVRGSNVFLSPDGSWVGFIGSDGLMKVPGGGGEPVLIAPTLVRAPGFFVGASWGSDDVIVYADDAGLFRVPADGGTPVKLLDQPPVDAGERLAWPMWLPGQPWVMFTVVPNTSGEEGARVEALNLDSGTRKVLVRNASRAQYVSSGHLVFKSQGAVHALPWDPAAMEPSGSPVAVVTSLAGRGFAASPGGTLVYPTGPASSSRELVWVDRRGTETRLGTPPRGYVYPRLSPDEERVAIDTIDANRDIWLWDIRRKTLDLFTKNDPSANTLVAWSPDGGRLAFGSARFGVANLFLQSSQGAGRAERLIESSRVQMPMSFTPDGRRLLFGEQGDVLEVALDGTRQVRALLQTGASEGQPEVSPDGRWLAYSSDESGQGEVYVLSYPDVSGDRWKISQGGGKQPVWSRSGGELFYLTATGAMMSVPLGKRPKLVPGIPVKLFEGSGYPHTGGVRTYDVAKDGRFLMVKPTMAADGSTGLSLTVVHNWVEELQRLAPSR